MGGKCIKVQFGQPTLVGQYLFGDDDEVWI
jgi:hypothetical protein